MIYFITWIIGFVLFLENTTLEPTEVTIKTHILFWIGALLMFFSSIAISIGCE